MKRSSTIAMLLCAVPAWSAFGQVYEWQAPIGGLWSDAANWNPVGVPDSSGEIAHITTAGAYEVTLDIPIQIDGFSLANAGATLRVIGTTLRAPGPITNQGVIVIQPSTGIVQAGSFSSPASATFLGTGLVRLSAAPASNASASIVSLSGTLSNAAGHTIEGTGRVSGSVSNAGVIAANVSGRELELTNGSFANSGTMRASNGGTLKVVGLFTQTATGTIVADGGTVAIAGSPSISGGNLESKSGGRLVTGTDAQVTLNSVRVIGELEIATFSNVTISGALSSIDGDVVVNTPNTSGNASLSFRVSPDVGAGAIVLNGTMANPERATLASTVIVDHPPARAVVGTGLVTGQHVFRGLISPGTAADRIGAIRGRGSFDAVTLGPTSRVRIDVDDLTHFDQLLRSTWNLGGTLVLAVHDPYAPALGDTIDVLANGVPKGKFDAFEAPLPADSSLRWRLRYHAEGVRAVVVCASDFDANGFVNGDDFDLFALAFVAGDGRADFNGDGFVTGDDFDAYVLAFEAGC